MLKAAISLTSQSLPIKQTGMVLALSQETPSFTGREKNSYLKALATCNLRKRASHHTDQNHTERHSVKLEG